MADAKDVATAVQSALEEIGVTGILDVSKDGLAEARTIGTLGADDVQVTVDIEDFEREMGNTSADEG